MCGLLAGFVCGRHHGLHTVTGGDSADVILETDCSVDVDPGLFTVEDLKARVEEEKTHGTEIVETDQLLQQQNSVGIT